MIGVLQLINKNNATRTFTKVSNMVMIMIVMMMMMMIRRTRS